MRKGLACLFLLAVLFAPGLARAVSDPSEMLPDPAQEQRAEQIGRQLRCLVCQNESIEDSGADLARDLRRIVRQRVAAGDSDAQVTAWLVARYGEFVRLSPRFTLVTSVLWLSPVLALAVGGVFAWGAMRRRAPPPPLSAEEQARLAELDS